MTIDLMAMAEQADETYIDVDATFGRLRVYHVPDALLLSGPSFFSEPDQPTVTMKTITGTQERPVKKGDPGYDEWRQEVNDIRERQYEIRQARGFVMGLRDIDWDKYDLTQPPPAKMAQETFADNWPDEDVLRKKIWLDFTVLRLREDKDEILEAINKMNTAYQPTDEMVEEVKKNSD